MSIEKIISQIIPPSDYEHRNGFSNISMLEKLTNKERKEVENELVNKLLHKPSKEVDTLIVETLAYLKSEIALPVLRVVLNDCANEMEKLKIATAIFEINQDNEMVDIAINLLRSMDNDKDSYYSHKLISAFYSLIKFKRPEVNKIIEGYVSHNNYSISYNAKRALSL